MKREELITSIHRLITPKFIKRKQITPLLNEFNRRAELRNKAYPKSDPWPTLVDDLQSQSSSSLDRTYDYLLEHIYESGFEDIQYWEVILDNEKKEKRRIESEEAAKLITINLKEEEKK